MGASVLRVSLSSDLCFALDVPPLYVLTLVHLIVTLLLLLCAVSVTVTYLLLTVTVNSDFADTHAPYWVLFSLLFLLSFTTN